MSRIAAVFAELAQKQKKALIPFITAGDPHPDMTVPLMHALVGAGADVIELGAPFSDPMADGPVIQRASERALAHGMSLRKTLAMVLAFRQTNAHTPVVIMGYANPIEIMGYAPFARLAKQSGVDGVLTVDLPPEEAMDCANCLKQQGIDPIFLLAPNSTADRVEKMTAMGSGYLYYVALKGVTGAGHLDTQDVAQKLQSLRRHTHLPIAIGFGIKDAQTAKTLAPLGEGVVVGSELIKRLEASRFDNTQATQAVIAFMSDLRDALDVH